MAAVYFILDHFQICVELGTDLIRDTSGRNEIWMEERVEGRNVSERLPMEVILVVSSEKEEESGNIQASTYFRW